MIEEEEFIYIVSNPSIPNKVKVGRTTNLQKRIKQLQSTGVPTPYKYEFVAIVEDSVAAERTAHYALRFNRVARDREFFEVSPETAILKITKEINFFKVNWAYTPQNKTTLSVRENYTKVAKLKIKNTETEIEKVTAALTEANQTLRYLEQKLRAHELALIPQEDFIVRFVVWIFNIKNLKILEREKKLLEIKELEYELHSQRHLISSRKNSRETLIKDLERLKDFYKNNLNIETTRQQFLVDQNNSTSTTSNKNYQFVNLKWYRDELGVHCEPLNKFYSEAELRVEGLDVAFMYEGALHHVPIAKIECWEEWEKTKDTLIKKLSEFRWHRTSELSFIDAENPLRKIKSSTVIVQPGYEGVLVTYENGKEIFVFADDISNFWKY